MLVAWIIKATHSARTFCPVFEIFSFSSTSHHVKEIVSGTTNSAKHGLAQKGVVFTASKLCNNFSSTKKWKCQIDLSRTPTHPGRCLPRDSYNQLSQTIQRVVCSKYSSEHASSTRHNVDTGSRRAKSLSVKLRVWNLIFLWLQHVTPPRLVGGHLDTFWGHPPPGLGCLVRTEEAGVCMVWVCVCVCVFVSLLAVEGVL